MFKHKLKGVTLFDVVNTLLVLLITFIIFYPLYFCVIASFSDYKATASGETFLWIKGFTLEAYQNMLAEDRIWVGYRNTIIYTILGTLYNLFMTIPAAYALSKKYLPFRGIISWYFFFTMYVGGGLIPYYLLMRDMHLVNNPLIMIVGMGVSVYNLIVTRQYFSTSIPEDIYEAARIDGASELKCFTNIAMPLAKPILAVMALYYGVGHWNSYYTAMIYIQEEAFKPLQLILRDLLMVQSRLSLGDVTDPEMMEYMIHKYEVAKTMKYSVIFVASLPLLIIYPFIQKYFAKGVMIGSVKG